MNLKLFFAIVAIAIAGVATACTVREVNANPPASPQKVQTTTSPKTKLAEADEQEVQFIYSKGYDASEYRHEMRSAI